MYILEGARGRGGGRICCTKHMIFLDLPSTSNILVDLPTLSHEPRSTHSNLLPLQVLSIDLQRPLLPFYSPHGDLPDLVLLPLQVLPIYLHLGLFLSALDRTRNAIYAK